MEITNKKYIFVTGGVVSSLGKGIAAASLGTLLEARGLKVTLQKFDPYLNVDPGTMSPYQHGEVYVLEDGAETDLDLGHYERFTNCVLSKQNSLSSGQVFQQVLDNERNGVYEGDTVQYVPHVTDEIKKRLFDVADAHPDCEIVITEIGGTVGDIEGVLFLEALRQFSLDVERKNCCFIHVSYLPYIAAADELKTKPTQLSVAKLREIGIHPDIILCRSEHDVEDKTRDKLALHCGVKREYVTVFHDIKPTVYRAPLDLGEDKLDEHVMEILNIKGKKKPDKRLKEWAEFVKAVEKPEKTVRVGLVGKYTELQDAYKSIDESLIHAGAKHLANVEIIKVDSSKMQTRGAKAVIEEANVDGILIPGGFGNRGTEGKILAAQYARENNLPYFGICLGMQIAVIEFARNVAKIENAGSSEFEGGCEHPVISLQHEQRTVRSLGGTMRLGGQESIMIEGTKSFDLYGKVKEISERHRHRYEFNADYRDQIESAGLTIAAVSKKEGLIEIIELDNHPFYVAAQFHPEFKSRPNRPHPLFDGFLEACILNSEKSNS